MLRADVNETTASESANDEDPMAPTDRAVIEALERGDREGALRLVMSAYGRAIFNYCSARLRDPSAVADVHQIVFIQAYNSFDSFSRTSSVMKWLFGIAHHRCVDAARDIRRRAWRVASVDPLPDEADPRPPCDDEIAALELAAMVMECIDKLKRDARTAVLLRYQKGLPYNEIANLCRESAPALQQRVSRAVQDLRRCLQKKGADL
jgi:RNA polymerase sigma-70 factor (ECF subfamily)